MSKTMTFDYFKTIRPYQHRRVRIISDDAAMKVSVPCEQSGPGCIVEAYAWVPLPKGTVLFGGTHAKDAYEWETYEWEYFHPTPDTDQGRLVRLAPSDFEIIEVVG